MASISKDKNGNIIIKDDKGVKHNTGKKVVPGDAAATKKNLAKAIGANLSKPGVISLQGKIGSIAAKLAAGKAPKAKKGKKGKPAKGKKKGKKKAPEKEEKKEKKEKKGKPAETVPKKKTVTIQITSELLSKAVSTVGTKADKKIRDELEKLAGAYGSLKDYIAKNESSMSKQIFKMLFGINAFKQYVTSPGAPTDKTNAMRKHLLSAMKEDKKLAAEIKSLGGIKDKGPIDAELFISSLLYVRREEKKNASLLKLSLVEAVEGAKSELEEEKKAEKDWSKETKGIVNDVVKGRVEIKLPEKYPMYELVEPLFEAFIKDKAYEKFVKSKKDLKNLSMPTIVLDTSPKKRFFIRSIQRYVKSKIDTDENYAKDLEAAGLGKTVSETGLLSTNLLKMVSMLKWREKNPSAPIWGTKKEKKIEKKEEVEKPKVRFNF